MNHWKHRLLSLAVCVCVVTTCFNTLHAEDDPDDEIPLPTQRETIRFLNDKLPLAIEVLERVKNDEGEEARKEVLNELQGRHHLYLETLEFDGQEAAGVFLGRVSLDLRMDVLLHNYHDVVETKAEKIELENRIRTALKEQLENDKREIRLELKLLEDFRKNLENELKDLESMRSDDIEEEMQQLLNEDQG